MSTIIQIKRNSGTTAPTTSDLIIGEMAYAYDASNNGASGKLYIEATNSSSAADIHIIGGKYYTDLLDHTLGTTTASSALLVDSNSKLDVINIDDVTIDGKVITMTGSSSDTAVLTAGTNGTLSIVTTDAAAAAANIQITADGTVDIDSAGVLTLDSGAAINIEPAAGSAILLDGTISVDAGVVTGATSITSTAFVGDITGDVTGNTSGTAATVTTAAQPAITSLGTLTTLTVDDINLNGKVVTMTGGTGDTAVLTAGTNGDLTITTTDAAGANANFAVSADGAISLTSAGVLTLDSGAAINIEPAAGSAILLDSTISVDAGVVTGATSITSTAFVGDITGDITGTADLATSITASANNSTNETVYPTFVDGATGTQGLETDTGLTYNPSSGILTGTQFTGAVLGNVTGNASGTAATVTGAAQTAITSVGTLTALTVDDINLNGKVVTMTGSSGDTAVFTAGTNGTLSIVTVDDAAAAANIQITADGTVDIDSAGVLTLDSGAAINIEPAAGSAILLDGTISVDAGVVTGATSITSTAFVGDITGDVTGNTSGTAATVTTAAQPNITSLGTLTALTVDDLTLNGQTISTTASNKNIILAPHGSGDVAITSDTLSVTGTEGEAASLFLIADESDDASDDWSITANTGGTLTFGNDIASAGTQVTHLTITPHATVASSTVTAAGNLIVSGNLTVSGTTTTVSSTVTTIADPLVELATGTSGTPSNDAGHVIERGDSDNIFIGWDESADVFTAATGSFTAASTGNLSITPAAAKFGSLTLTTDLAVAEGGTGVSTFTDKGIVYGDGSSALDVTAAPGGSDVTASFQILTCGSSNGNPVWTTTIDGGTY